MKFYLDKEKKEEVIPSEDEKFTLHFGRVEAGTEKTMTLYIYNDNSGVLEDMEYTLPKIDGLKILSAPKVIQPYETEQMEIKWSPSLKFEKSLNVELRIKMLIVYYA